MFSVYINRHQLSVKEQLVRRSKKGKERLELMINNVGFSYNRAGFKATYPEKLPEKLQKAIKDIPQDKFDAAIEKVSYIDRGTGERKFDISGFKKAADTYSISSDERNIYDLAGDVVSYVQVQRYEAKKRR